jgi:hypothetical protein
MIALRAVVLLALGLAVQAGLARLWPSSVRYLDVMVLPVLWYATTRSQRSAILVGCAAGLSYDAWFRAGVFGMGGFIKTFLGWAAGAVGSRIDLNSQVNRFAAAFLFTWLEGPLELGLRRLLDQVTETAHPLEWTARAALTAVAVVAIFPVLDRTWGVDRRSGYPGRG